MDTEKRIHFFMQPTPKKTVKTRLHCSIQNLIFTVRLKVFQPVPATSATANRISITKP